MYLICSNDHLKIYFRLLRITLQLNTILLRKQLRQWVVSPIMVKSTMILS